ncbi:4Fe-4S binding protein [Psychromarinibacter sp. C21-152]|uniref:4Fe-4S binding protein n=1 Tax=Psychromarinibacter sediminicola TaxID=3033385 RepID=A0AAE3NWI1_9RHOB|nr:NosR/NirI family protein [Psychromarinibacter sediminicola]MDF0603546.1 4Fe-4S binding protein [Psychromarinibacter sediminicola]
MKRALEVEPFAVLCLLVAALLCAVPAAAQPRLGSETRIAPAEPDAALAAALFGVPGPVTLVRTETPVPGWQVAAADGTPLGRIGSSWEIATSVGYSGRPIDMLVAVTPQARIAGARLMQHSEPILTLGLTDADIARFVAGFAGLDLTAPGQADALRFISRATVTTAVIRDTILRTGRTLALADGGAGGGRIDRLTYEPHDWAGLAQIGAVQSATMTMAEAAAALAGADRVPEPGEGHFLDLHVALLDPPEIGRNLLGRRTYSGAMGDLPADRVALFVASRGLHSHRGLAWRRTGTFDRVAVIQDGRRFPVTDTGYLRLDELAAEGAPQFRERSLFRIGGDGFDPAAPFRVAVTATRDGATGPVTATLAVDYALPERFLLPPPPEDTPLWQEMWQSKRPAILGVAAMLTVLTGILFVQDSIVRRPMLWRRLRLTFLAVTLVWLGWTVNAQLSVVQVVAFVQSLLSGFRWETFLVEPLIFLLWSFVALGLLFWGRGVFCGWLCPFGALQELTNEAAQKLGVKQIQVPHALHQRLWVIKYTLFLAILALSFYSMKDALILAEAEPFKTAISMRMMRAWPFVAFVLVVLAAGLFIERFYCRYLCPLGAALAIPAKLKIFDWLRRRPQCGRECRLCEPKCTVGAIDPIGRINPNECVLCLRCQVIYHDPKTCPTLKRRARSAA